MFESLINQLIADCNYYKMKHLYITVLSIKRLLLHCHALVFVDDELSENAKRSSKSQDKSRPIEEVFSDWSSDELKDENKQVR